MRERKKPGHIWQYWRDRTWEKGETLASIISWNDNEKKLFK